MWANRSITIEVIEESKASGGKAFIYRPGADGTTGGAKDTGFNDTRWGATTRDYVTSASSLSKDTLKLICKLAKAIAKATQKSSRAPSPSASGFSKPGRRAVLVDVPMDECKWFYLYSIHGC